MNTEQLRADQAFKAKPIEERLRIIARMLPKGWSSAELQLEAADALADRDRRIEALTKALQSAILALRSYQYGNCSGELAQSVADACSKALAIAQDMEGNYHDSENLQSRDRRCHPSA